MSAHVLADRDVNAHLGGEKKVDATDPKSMEYHRQILQSRMNDESAKSAYVSPSDNIMSPCTAKLAAMKNKHFSKAKPQSLFAKKVAARSQGAMGPTSDPLAAEETPQTTENAIVQDESAPNGTE